MNETWLALDVPNLVWRSFFSLPYLSHKGVRTEAVFGVLRDIVFLQHKFATCNICFCFDLGRSRRYELCKSYKANRLPTIPNKQQEKAASEVRKQLTLLRKEYLPETGFNNVFSCEGYEADDLIASVCVNSKNKNFIIVSNDHDLYQLLNNRVSIWNPRNKELITEKSFTQEYGITPEQWIEVKALAGCSSDNIEGIQSIGEATAIKYLRNELKPSYKSYKAIQNGAETMERNRKLVKLPFPGTPVFDLKADTITREKWHTLLDKLGIKRIGELSQPTFNW